MPTYFSVLLIGCRLPVYPGHQTEFVTFIYANLCVHMCDIVWTPCVVYINFLLVGLPKVRCFPIQSSLNTAARLIAQLPQYSPRISTYMFNELH